jgi:hypothetical protein
VRCGAQGQKERERESTSESERQRARERARAREHERERETESEKARGREGERASSRAQERRRSAPQRGSAPRRTVEVGRSGDGEPALLDDLLAARDVSAFEPHDEWDLEPDLLGRVHDALRDHVALHDACATGGVGGGLILVGFKGGAGAQGRQRRRGAGRRTRVGARRPRRRDVRGIGMAAERSRARLGGRLLACVRVGASGCACVVARAARWVGARRARASKDVHEEALDRRVLRDDLEGAAHLRAGEHNGGCGQGRRGRAAAVRC